MPLNIPKGSSNNVSFGPARVFMAPFGTAPGITPTDAATFSLNSAGTDDVGWIGEDGVSIELSSEKKEITQGNPKLINFSFVMAQGATIKFTSIEWDFNQISYALGAGTTSGDGTAGSTSTFNFGGNPLNTHVCIHVQHEMAVTGDTLDMYVWKAQSEAGFSMPFGADEHAFEYSFKAVRAITDWGGTALSI